MLTWRKAYNTRREKADAKNQMLSTVCQKKKYQKLNAKEM